MRKQSAHPPGNHIEQGIWEAVAIKGDCKEDETSAPEDVLDLWVSAFKGLTKRKDNKGICDFIFYRGNETIGYDNFMITRAHEKRPKKSGWKEGVLCVAARRGWRTACSGSELYGRTLLDWRTV